MFFFARTNSTFSGLILKAQYLQNNDENVYAIMFVRQITNVFF